MRKCPYCAEEIQDEAIKCKHCGSTQPEQRAKTKKKFKKIFKRIILAIIVCICIRFIFDFIYYDIYLRSEYVKEINSKTEEDFFKLTEDLFDATIRSGGRNMAEYKLMLGKIIPMRAEIFCEKYPNSAYKREMETMRRMWSTMKRVATGSR